MKCIQDRMLREFGCGQEPGRQDTEEEEVPRSSSFGVELSAAGPLGIEWGPTPTLIDSTVQAQSY
eukprot:COSAG04_NODE_3186_length_3075_cov_2.017809_6_plen_65_part_00